MGLIQSERKEQFCCSGCSAAWSLIHDNGLDAFYRMVDSQGEQQTLRGRRAARKFGEFDTDGFHNRFVQVLGADPTKQESAPAETEQVLSTTFALDGIHCAACIWLIEKLPTIVPGVCHANVNWSRGTVTLSWMKQQVNLSRVAEALDSLGYTPFPQKENTKTKRREKENRRHLVRIGIAAAAAGNNMIIAAALYFGMFSFMAHDMETMLRWASCIVGMASFLGPGRVFLMGAWNALKTRTPHMDLPIAVGLIAGSLSGLINTVLGSGEIYFDSLSILICLLLIGRWIQFRQQNRAADAVDMLYRLTPRTARKRDNGKVVEVSADDLSVNDEIEVWPGDVLPADGIVTNGSSKIDEAILTGESNTVRKIIGDKVLAGSLNSESTIVVQVTATEDQTRISKIVGLVETASNNKPAIVQWADQIGGYFVVTVLLLAGLTFTSWMFIDSSRAIDRTVALLIVACPCALAMATPLAISVALGRLARNRIMVKVGDVLQSLSKPGIVWLDKTGTLTEGKMNVAVWHGDPKWVPIVAEIESESNHPIASALKLYGAPTAALGNGNRTDLVVPVNGVMSHINGLSALVDQTRVLVGNRYLLAADDVQIDEVWHRHEKEILAEGHSPCWIAANNEVVGLVGLGDTIRSDAPAVIGDLRQQGWAVGVLSGDHAVVVSRIAKTLGISEVHAGVSPEEKLHVIEDSQSSYQTVVMVGDGVNDSAALAAATVGIAVHGGAEASLAAAPVYLAHSGLSGIQELIRASVSTTSTIRINFAASLGYNILGVGLAMVGWLNPLVAAILMPISSLTVISLSTMAARKASQVERTQDPVDQKNGRRLDLAVDRSQM